MTISEGFFGVQWRAALQKTAQKTVEISTIVDAR